LITITLTDNQLFINRNIEKKRVTPEGLTLFNPVLSVILTENKKVALPV
tara:strand:- start:1417 stop:1563 length:147 start_codon:yes stop_codon:yes gene_type:complete